MPPASHSSSILAASADVRLICRRRRSLVVRLSRRKMQGCQHGWSCDLKPVQRQLLQSPPRPAETPPEGRTQVCLNLGKPACCIRNVAHYDCRIMRAWRLDIIMQMGDSGIPVTALVHTGKTGPVLNLRFEFCGEKLEEALVGEYFGSGVGFLEMVSSGVTTSTLEV